MISQGSRWAHSHSIPVCVLLSDWYVAGKLPALTHLTNAQIGQLNGRNVFKIVFIGETIQNMKFKKRIAMNGNQIVSLTHKL